MGRPKGCVPWNKGLDQRTGKKSNPEVQAVLNTWRRMVREAVKLGLISHPSKCPACGKDARTYAFPRVGATVRGPLEVNWRCHDCQPKGNPWMPAFALVQSVPRASTRRAPRGGKVRVGTP